MTRGVLATKGERGTEETIWHGTRQGVVLNGWYFGGPISKPTLEEAVFEKI